MPERYAGAICGQHHGGTGTGMLATWGESTEHIADGISREHSAGMLAEYAGDMCAG